MSKQLEVSLAVFAVAALIVGSAAIIQAQDTMKDVTGTWTWAQEGPGGQIDFTLKLKQDGEKLTGSITGFGGDESPIENGKYKDGTISFKVTRDFGGRPFVTNYTLKPSGDTLKGRAETIFANEFEAKKSK